MSKKAATISALITLSLIVISGCDKSGLPASAITAGKYIILDTRTDQADRATAKKNAENTLRKYPDIDAMVGLWAYNIPQCLEALKDSGMEGKVKLISFDEDELTLQGIKDGHIHGTIVQQPYQFGYQSVKYLKALEEGDTSMIPANKMLDIPTKEIKKDNVDEFWTELKTLQQLGETAKAAERPATGLHFAFVVNLPSAFWSYARAGCYKAEQDFGVSCDFRIPHDGSSAEQNKILENLIQKDEIKGIAVSPLDPKNQTELLNRVGEKVKLICHDSDAPDSNRLFYLGTNNYLAGRQVGKLIKEALPDGGTLMIYVGKLDVLNAQQRRKGVIDELMVMDKPMPQ
jgi:ribose transport system substrate-binding protein